MKILIIGGVAGGASAATRLRRLDESAEIVILERGDYVSFANCGLPYYVSNTIPSLDELILQNPESFKERFNIEVRLNNEAVKINPSEKNILVKDLKTGKEYIETYDQMILSPGAKPFTPFIKGVNEENIFSVRSINDIVKVKEFIQKNSPQKAVVVGGGFIGLEMAENLKEENIHVTIVERMPKLMGNLDIDFAKFPQQYLKSQGIDILLEESVQEISKKSGKTLVRLKNQELEADFVILSVGVVPDTSFLENSNIKMNERGGILVSAQMETSAPDIYAVGDAVEIKHYITQENTMIPLAGPANKQGRMVADNIVRSISESYDGTQGSSIIKIFDMTVATTGLNEISAKNAGYDYDKIFTVGRSHAAYYPNAESIITKTIFEKNTGKILGVQMFGSKGVDKRCDVVATAIHFGSTSKDLTKLELCYAPPYSSAKDPVNFIGYIIENILNGYVKIFHFDEISSIRKDKSAVLLDVRTQEEHLEGHIEGTINIPVDELRKNMNTFSKDKKYYVTCQSGQRSYLACRILMQNGFEAYNLSGGYSVYQVVGE